MITAGYKIPVEPADETSYQTRVDASWARLQAQDKVKTAQAALKEARTALRKAEKQYEKARENFALTPTGKREAEESERRHAQWLAKWNADHAAKTAAA